MAEKARSTLTEAELRVMRVHWERGEATVSDVVGAIKKPRLARNTVQTMLGILERKNFASHRSVGRSFVYRPKIDREAVQHGALDYVLSRFFNDSPEELMMRLIGRQRISKQESERIRALFEEQSDAS